jgi:hypothetical protein
LTPPAKIDQSHHRSPIFIQQRKVRAASQNSLDYAKGACQGRQRLTGLYDLHDKFRDEAMQPIRRNGVDLLISSGVGKGNDSGSEISRILDIRLLQ